MYICIYVYIHIYIYMYQNIDSTDLKRGESCGARRYASLYFIAKLSDLPEACAKGFVLFGSVFLGFWLRTNVLPACPVFRFIFTTAATSCAMAFTSWVSLILRLLVCYCFLVAVRGPCLSVSCSWFGVFNERGLAQVWNDEELAGRILLFRGQDM